MYWQKRFKQENPDKEIQEKILQIRMLHKDYGYRRFTSSVPYQKIVTDTTEFKYFEKDSRGNEITKKLYLNPFMDLYNS